MPNRTMQHDDADLAYDVSYRPAASAAVAFDQSPTDRRRQRSRYSRQGKPSLKRVGGLHRRGNKRSGL